jgi:hypothetical protein
MMSSSRSLALFAAGFGFVLPSAMAQSLLQTAPKTLLEAPSQAPWGQFAPPADTAEDVGDASPAAEIDPMKDIDVSKLDWSQLNIDPSSFSGQSEARARANKSASVNAGNGVNWSNDNKANGASAVSVKRSVSPFWDARIGADMTVAKQPTTMSELLAEKAENGGNVLQSGGSAWAALTAPGAGSIWDKTAVEARVDPGSDQSRIGATITKAVPLDGYNLSLQNGYNVTQQGLVPIPGAAPRTNRSFDTEQSAKLAIGDTGASIIAGQSLSSSDDKWLRRVGAEQKLYDGVTVSGSIGETSQGVTNKSIAAGFKRSW